MSTGAIPIPRAMIATIGFAQILQHIAPYSVWVIQESESTDATAAHNELLCELSKLGMVAVDLRKPQLHNHLRRVPKDTNTLTVHFTRTLHLEFYKLFNATDRQADMHMFAMSSADIQLVELAVLGELWLNGVFLELPDREGQEAEIQAWCRHGNGTVASLKRFSVAEFFADDSLAYEARIFANRFRFTPPHSGTHQLVVLGDLQTPNQFNVTNTERSKWSVLGGEWSLAGLLAQLMHTKRSGYMFKWSHEPLGREQFEQLSHDERAHQLRTYAAMVPPRDSHIRLVHEHPQNVIQRLHRNHIVLLTNVLSEFSNHPQHAYPHMEHRTRIIVPNSQRDGRDYGQDFRQQSLAIAVFAVFSAAFAAVRIGLQRTHRRMAGRTPAAAVHRVARMAFPSLWTDTMARILSVGGSVEAAARAESIWLYWLSVAAMIMGTHFAGVFYEQFLIGNDNNLDTMAQLVASGLPVSVSEEFMDTEQWWRENVNSFVECRAPLEQTVELWKRNRKTAFVMPELYLEILNDEHFLENGVNDYHTMKWIFQTQPARLIVNPWYLLARINAGIQRFVQQGLLDHHGRLVQHAFRIAVQRERSARGQPPAVTNMPAGSMQNYAIAFVMLVLGFTPSALCLLGELAVNRFA